MKWNNGNNDCFVFEELHESPACMWNVLSVPTEILFNEIGLILQSIGWFQSILVKSIAIKMLVEFSIFFISSAFAGRAKNHSYDSLENACQMARSSWLKRDKSKKVVDGKRKQKKKYRLNWRFEAPRFGCSRFKKD